MAKRFTDTDKWKKKFIRDLNAPYKVLWLYILDECDHAGIWHVEVDVAKIRTGCVFDESIAVDKFGGNIQVIDNGRKWFIPDFIDFQYGQLNPSNKVHKSVLDILNKYKIKGYANPLQGAKDKDKEKDKEKDKVKVNAEIFQNIIEDAIWFEVAVLKNFGISHEEFITLFTKFWEVKYSWQINKQEDVNDIKIHFTNWLNSESKKLKNGQKGDFIKYAAEQLANDPDYKAL